MIENDTNTSVFDPTKELRVIRSHRRPPQRRRWVAVLAIAGVLATGAATPMRSSVAKTVSSPVAQVLEVEVRGSTVDRSARAALTRNQKIEKVIAYAMAQRGDRYKWGAAGPYFWDCSGLVAGAFKRGAGITLPHFTGGIQKKGVRVAKKNLKRGDIIFPQRGHVGIYLGGGKMVHASSGKGRVIVAGVYGYYTARRIL